MRALGLRLGACLNKLSVLDPVPADCITCVWTPASVSVLQVMEYETEVQQYMQASQLQGDGDDDADLQRYLDGGDVDLDRGAAGRAAGGGGGGGGAAGAARTGGSTGASGWRPQRADRGAGGGAAEATPGMQQRARPAWMAGGGGAAADTEEEEGSALGGSGGGGAAAAAAALRAPLLRRGAAAAAALAAAPATAAPMAPPESPTRKRLAQPPRLLACDVEGECMPVVCASSGVRVYCAVVRPAAAEAAGGGVGGRARRVMGWEQVLAGARAASAGACKCHSLSRLVLSFWLIISGVGKRKRCHRRERGTHGEGAGRPSLRLRLVHCRWRRGGRGGRRANASAVPPHQRHDAGAPSGL